MVLISMKTTAVVVTFNRLFFLKECIQALKNQTLKLSTIIIINNNSNDGTEEFLKKYDSDDQFIIINLKENIGGAGGFNRGIRSFIENTNDDFVWLMDDDTIPTDTAHFELIQATSTINKFGFLASNVRWIDNTPAKMNIPKINEDNWNELKDYPRLSCATFVSILIDRHTVVDKGYPIKEFFIWGDDTEYTLRISSDYKCYYVPESIVIHKIGINEGAVIFRDYSEKDRLIRYRYAYRNRFYYTRNRESKDKILYFARVLNDIRRIVFFENPNKLYKLKLLILGTLEGMFFKPKIEFPNSKDKEK